MRVAIIALMLMFGSQAGADCGNLCDRDWWKTATESEVQAELSGGADLMARDQYGLTPLHLAAVDGTRANIQVLLDAGADLNASDKDGFTPLLASLLSKTSENYEYLTNAGAKSWNSNTLISGVPIFIFLIPWYEQENSALWSIPVLFDKRANINVRFKDGDTPLQFAVRVGRIELVKMLLDLGANVNVRDEFGNTLLHYRSQFGRQTSNVEIFQLLAGSKEAKIEARNVTGETPLISTAALGSPENVQVLIDSGADITAKDINGSTAWDRAKSNTQLQKNNIYWELEVNSGSCGRLCDARWWSYASEVNLQAQLKKGAFKKLTKEERENVWLLAQGSPLHRSAAYWALNEQRWN